MVRGLGVDHDIAVGIAGLCRGHRDSLKPAVHAADRIGLYGKGQVLVYAGVGPPDQPGVWVVAAIGRLTVLPAEPPPAVVVLINGGLTRPPGAGRLLFQPPTAHVVAGRNHTGTDPLRTPRRYDEVADPGRDAD